MTRLFIAATAVSFVLGTTAYAGTPSSKTLAFNSQGTVSSTVPVFSPANLGVAGATGRAIVPGNKSTISGDAAATRTQQTGAFGGGN